MKVADIKLNKLVAEFIGTFALTFGVLASINGFINGVPTAIVAGSVLFLSVLAIGATSGSHINPAVTVAFFSLKKISLREAFGYIAAQMFGALAAFSFLNLLIGNDQAVLLEAKRSWDSIAALAEAFGAAFFTFGIAAAVSNKYKDVALAALIGGSLTLGIVFAAAAGSFGILNPAVALGLGVFNWSYLVGPIIGGVVGANLYSFLIADK